MRCALLTTWLGWCRCLDDYIWGCSPIGLENMTVDFPSHIIVVFVDERRYWWPRLGLWYRNANRLTKKSSTSHTLYFTCRQVE